MTPWERLAQGFDVLIIGGGVTGAGVFFEASRRGLSAILVERGDFASGTSSRSSKLVHGGLRYLSEGKIGLTRESVHEREALLHCAPGLVDTMPFLMPHYLHRRPSRIELSLGLALYDLFAGQSTHRFLSSEETLRLAPLIDHHELLGAHHYRDATTDDARLVLRLIQEGQAHGGIALNYTDVRSLLRRDGRVVGATITDTVGRTMITSPRAVINATGVHAADVLGASQSDLRLRPLRGSHLLFPDWRLPLAQSIAFPHPHDGRPVFAYPWLGAVLVGTTDTDHNDALSSEPRISRAEFDYLLDAVRSEFPRSAITESDVLSTYAGVRPVVDDGRANPSKAGRDHVVLHEPGIVTVTGGKLTTFRPMAMQALRALAPMLAPTSINFKTLPILPTTSLPQANLPRTIRQQLAGRFGSRSQEIIALARADELEPIGAMPTLWAELRWSARNEQIMHLEDLLLRRTRIGILAPFGGKAHLPRIRRICQEELNWDDERMQAEETAYSTLIAQRYSRPA